MKQISAIAILSLFLISCGGDDGFDSGGTDTTTNDSGGSTSTDTGIRIGSGTGSAFVEGVLNVAATTALSAGGSTSVTVTLVTSTGAPYTTATDVAFTSDCAAQGLATLTSPVSTSNGSATSTYTAIGCSGTDTITATATVGSDLLAASDTVAVAAAEIGSVQFVSASPTTIGLKGTGGAGLQETSTVTFKVINESGGPVIGQNVTFSLSTDVGGITFSPTEGETGADGKVSTVVQSGSIATPVRVIAVVDDTTIQTQSDQLTITTGIPVAGGLSLSLETFNPEAFNYDGVDVQAFANVMDRFHNPVPNGTVVNFRTEAGRIVGSCTTTDGSCAATWTSQNAELAGGDADGVSTILAYAIGEESFDDENGNGRYDDDDTFTTDLDEAFVDYDFDGTRDAGEPFIDFNVDGTYDAAGDGEFNGVLCEHSTDCSTNTSLIVSDRARIVMSTSAADIRFYTDGTLATELVPFVDADLTVRDGAADTITILVQDENTNIMPAGTTITVTVASGAEVSGTTSFVVPNAASLSGTVITLGFSDADPVAAADSRGAGFVDVVVTTPGGTKTLMSYPITY